MFNIWSVELGTFLLEILPFIIGIRLDFHMKWFAKIKEDFIE